MENDSLRNYLIMQCRYQLWAREQIKKIVKEVDQINVYSIASVKQKLK